MLRRKLITRLGLLAAALLAVAATGLWVLRGSLDDLSSIDSHRADITLATVDLENRITELESRLLDSTPLPTTATLTLSRIHQSIDILDGHIADVDEDGSEASANLREFCATLDERISTGTNSSTTLSDSRKESLRAIVAMRAELAVISRVADDLAANQRATVIANVHRTAIWLGLGVLAVTIGAGLVIYSAARLVLRPISALLQVSRELSCDRFDARVPSGQPVEFAELAAAYNTLAAKVQEGEKRTLDTLHHLALTLNHELNNAIAIIEMQLERLNRQNPGDATMGTRLTEIRETLGRMTRTVKSLTSLKRIVLTEYLPGQKMLDLERSVDPDQLDDTNGSPEWTEPEVKTATLQSPTSTRSS